MKVRSVDERVARYRLAGDPFGWEREVLGRYFDAATAEAVMEPKAFEAWETTHAPDDSADTIVADASRYLDYAWSVALSHRNIPAQRSMFKLDYWCWLLGAEPLLIAERTPQGLYRVGALRAAAEYIGYEFPPTRISEFLDSPVTPITADQQNRIARMADGVPCVLMCPDGCLWKREDDAPTDPIEATATEADPA